MYQVSAAFKEAIGKEEVRYDLKGTIGGTAFTKDNILRGTFKIKNQCSEDSEVQIGTVFIGQLNATFTGLEIDKYKCIGKKIIPQCGVMIAPGLYEYVPMGEYIINEAEWSAAGLTVLAYDNMSLMDKRCDTQLNGKAFEIATFACEECGLELANQDFSEFVNAGDDLPEFPENDIETYRDVLHWISQAVGAFATANRQGKIEFRKYGRSIREMIDEYSRFKGGKYSDYITRYTGMSCVDLDGEEETTTYYNVSPDDGLTYNLGSNPFLQTSLVPERCRENVLQALTEIQYVPFEVPAVANPAFDLGDVICLPNRLADGSKLFCITKYEFDYNGTLKLKGAGKNPALASAKSKSDKSIAGIKKASNEDKIRYYLFTNATEHLVEDGEDEKIIEIRFQCMKPTIVIFHAEILLKADTTVDDITYHDAVGQIRYVWHEMELTDYKPKETWTDGNHVLHLLYYFTITDSQMNHFEVYLNMNGGSAYIQVAGIKSAIFGQNLYATDNFDGILKIEESMADVPASIAAIAMTNNAGELLAHSMQGTASDSYAESMENVIALISAMTINNSMSETVNVEVDE